MNRPLAATVLPALSLLLSTVVRADPVFVDDFNTPGPGSTWTVVQDDPARVWLDDAAGRLALRATATPAALDAICLSNGTTPLRLRTDADFQMQVTFHFTAAGAGLAAVDLGFGADASGDNSLSIAAGSLLGGSIFGMQYRVADAPTSVTWARSTADGALFISYDALADKVFLSSTGFGEAHADRTLTGLVRGTWAADSVLIGLGGYSQQMAVGDGAAWLDDFTIVSGSVVPEPTSLALLGLGGLSWVAARGRAARRSR